MTETGHRHEPLHEQQEVGYVNLAFTLEHKLACPYPRCLAQAEFEARFTLGPGPDGQHHVRLPLASRSCFSCSDPSVQPRRSVELRLPSPDIVVSCRCARDLNQCVPELLKLVCRAYNHFHIILDQTQRCLVSAR